MAACNFTVKVPTLTVDEMRDGVRTIVPYDEARLSNARSTTWSTASRPLRLQKEFEEFC